MKVTYAAFHITHKKKSYSVQYEVSAVTQNLSQVIVTVQDSEGNVLNDPRAESGRQIISPWNAKQALTKVLTEKGLYKPHKKEEPGHDCGENFNKPVKIILQSPDFFLHSGEMPVEDETPQTEEELKFPDFGSPDF